MGSNVFHTSDLGACSIDRMYCLEAMISVRDFVIVSASITGIQMKRGKEGFLLVELRRESEERTLDLKGGRLQRLLQACWCSDCNSLFTNSKTYLLVICIIQLPHWGKRGVVT